MTSTIWKFELQVTDVQRVRMPVGSRLLYVGAQDRGGPWVSLQPTLWALVDPNAPYVDRLIAVVGTGNPAPDVDDEDSIYVGTAICGALVWHIFDGGENHAI